MRTFRLLPVFFAFLAAARADVVLLSNGDRVSGQLVSADAKTVVIRTAWAGELKIDRAAVADLRPENPLYVTLAEGAVIVSRVEASGEHVRLVTPDGLVKTVSPGEIAAMRNEAAQRAWEREEERWKHPRLNDFWRGSVTFSVANTAGNARTATLSTAATAVREAGRNVLALNFSQIYATQSTTEPFGPTANRISGSIRADRRANGRLFLYGINAYDYDRFLSLDLRSVFGGGLGVKPWMGRRGSLELSGGANWNREKFSRDEGPLVRNSGEAAAGQELNIQLTSRLRLNERAGFFPNLTNRGEYRINFDANAAVPLMRWLEWTVGVNDRYLSNPLPGKKKNDVAVTMGVRLSFDQTRR
jgi:putative salt-induced outer membrane protein YdiY